MSANTLTGIENGHQRPSLERARALSEALGIELEELFAVCECDCGCGDLIIDQARQGSSARYLPDHNCRQPEHGASIARAHRARRARLGIPEEKICARCGRTFTRSEVPDQSLAHWLKRRFCSNECFCPERGQSRPCSVCGKPFLPSYRADPSRRCCCGSHGQRLRFEAGNVAPAFVERMPGRARQRWGGRWGATKPPAPGANPRGRPSIEITDEQHAEILKLAGQRWGRRAIATRLQLSERTIRNVLGS
jgi:hypothetical protein